MAYTGPRRASRGFVNIEVLGDKETSRLLHKLPLYLQKNVVSVSLKEAFAPALAAVKQEAQALEAGGGKMARVAEKVKIKAIKRKKGNLGWRLVMPRRVELGIPPTHKYYYPYAVEFGGKYTAPNPFLYRAKVAAEGAVIRIARDLISKGVRLGWESRA